MDFVHEVGGVAHAHERTSRVDVVLPSVQLLITLEGKVEFLVLGLQEQTVRLKICPLDVGDIREVDEVRSLR